MWDHLHTGRSRAREIKLDPPPAKTWLYAGYVGTQQNFCTLQKYGAQYAQRILVLMDAAIPMATEDKSDISWPLPPALRFTKVATAAMSEERMRKEARTCMRASLVLIGTNGQVNASEQAMVPGWMRLWPLMHSKYTNMDDLARHSTSQPALKRELALELSTRTNAVWWWTDAKGALGQAVHTGILPLETGTVLEQSMPLHQRAHLGAAHYWQSSVLLATIFNSRAEIAGALLRLHLPTMAEDDLSRLRQHMSKERPKVTRAVLKHGWRGAPQTQINLGSVTNPVTGLQEAFLPKRRAHQHLSAVKMLERLTTIAKGEGTLGTSPGNERRWQDGPWANVTDSGMCMGAGCETSYEETQEQGMILPNGQLLCHVCHEKWAAHVCRKLGLARGPRCAKDDNGHCLSCTFEDKEARSKLRHLMIRTQLRDLCHRLFRQLNCNVQGMAANALHKAVRNLHLSKDHRHLFSIPASVLRSVLGRMAWNFNAKTANPIGSVPCHEHAGEQWAEDCKRAFNMIDLNPARSCTLSRTPVGIEVMQTEYPALRELQTTLKAHSGTCASVMQTREGLEWLYGYLGIGNLTDPEPEDFSLRDHTEATCCICKDNTQDRRMENGVEVGELDAENCMACTKWWHPTCLSAAERLTLPLDSIADVEEGLVPPWRCQECFRTDQYCVNRILDVVRTEQGKFCLVLEYLGYKYYEVGLPVNLKSVHKDLTSAYRAHKAQRTSDSLLHVVGTIIEATLQHAPLEGLGLEVRLTHTDKALYLMSHESLLKRGFSQGMPNLFQMLGDDYRMAIPLVYTGLLRTTKGQALPSMPDRNSDTETMERAEGTSALTEHLTAITSAASLPAVLGRAANGVEPWDGLGLISGSTAKDIITVLTAFINKYDRANWEPMVRAEFPGVTDEEIQWLSTMPEAAGQSASPAARTPRGSSKLAKAGTAQAGLGAHRDKRGRTDSSSWSAGKTNRARSRSASPPRRSTRHRTEPEQTTNNEQHMSGPPGLDRQTGTHRRQLARAFRKLYGTPEVPYGIIFGLTVLARYVNTLAAQFGTSPDPIIYFHTPDMRRTEKWKPIPAHLDPTQQAVSFDQASNKRKAETLNRESGQGPTPGRPP